MFACFPPLLPPYRVAEYSSPSNHFQGSIKYSLEGLAFANKYLENSPRWTPISAPTPPLDK